MISTVDTRKGTAALTSDRWHVVHARFVGTQVRLPFVRSISSEHDTRESCVQAARALVARVRGDAGEQPAEQRDQVFVRRPGFKTLKNSKRWIARPSKGGRA